MPHTLPCTSHATARCPPAVQHALDRLSSGAKHSLTLYHRRRLANILLTAARMDDDQRAWCKRVGLSTDEINRLTPEDYEELMLAIDVSLGRPPSFRVETILEHTHDQTGRTMYHVLWTHGVRSWEPEEHFVDDDGTVTEAFLENMGQPDRPDRGAGRDPDGRCLRRGHGGRRWARHRRRGRQHGRGSGLDGGAAGQAREALRATFTVNERRQTPARWSTTADVSEGLE